MDYDYIKQGDCLELMKEIPDGSIDVVLCDLPYGYTACYWDKALPLELLWEQYLRIAKENAPFVLFCNEPFTSQLVTSKQKLFRQKLTWLKTRPTNVFNAKKQFMNWTEDILVFYRKLPTFNPQMRTDGTFTGSKVQHANSDRSNGTLGSTGEKKGYVHASNGGLFFPKSVLEYSNVHNGAQLHPTQKPVDLLRYLIRTYSNEGDIVLDNTMGSGSTCVAAIMEKRRYIGFELNQEYFDIAKRRIEQASQQLTLF